MSSITDSDVILFFFHLHHGIMFEYSAKWKWAEFIRELKRTWGNNMANCEARKSSWTNMNTLKWVFLMVFGLDWCRNMSRIFTHKLQHQSSETAMDGYLKFNSRDFTSNVALMLVYKCQRLNFTYSTALLYTSTALSISPATKWTFPSIMKDLSCLFIWRAMFRCSSAWRRQKIKMIKPRGNFYKFHHVVRTILTLLKSLMKK